MATADERATRFHRDTTWNVQRRSRTTGNLPEQYTYCSGLNQGNRIIDLPGGALSLRERLADMDTFLRLIFLASCGYGEMIQQMPKEKPTARPIVIIDPSGENSTLLQLLIEKKQVEIGALKDVYTFWKLVKSQVKSWKSTISNQLANH